MIEAAVALIVVVIVLVVATRPRPDRAYEIVRANRPHLYDWEVDGE